MDVPSIRVADADGCPLPLERDINGLSLSQLKDPVEFSNACRAFYKARVEATARMKERVRRGYVSTGSSGSSNSINISALNGSNSYSNSDSNSSSNNSAISGSNSNSDNNSSAIRGNNSNSSINSSDNIDDNVLGLKEGADSSWSDPLGGDLHGSVTSCVHNGEQARARRRSNRDRPNLDSAMEVLRREMAALMDLDLSLMKQLLTLNEEIEDLKWRRRRGWVDNCGSSQEGSWDMMQSAASLSNRLEAQPTLKFATPSSLSLQLEGNENLRFSVYDDEDHTNTFNRGKKSQQPTSLNVSCAANDAAMTATATTTPSIIPSGLTGSRHDHNSNDQNKRSKLTRNVFAVSKNAILVKSPNKNLSVISSRARENSNRHEPASTVAQSEVCVKPNATFLSKEPPSVCKFGTSDALSCNTDCNGTSPSSPHPASDNRNQQVISQTRAVAGLCPASSNATVSSTNLCPSSIDHIVSNTESYDNNKTRKPYGAIRTPAIPQETPVSSAHSSSAKVHPLDISAVKLGHVKCPNHDKGLHKTPASRTSPNTGNPDLAQITRKKNKSKSIFKPASGGALRHSKKKAKGATGVSNGDTESHDSGINDVFN